MKSGVISVLAEVASSVLPEGAVEAAIEMASLTVMEVTSVSTDIVIEMSCVAPGAISGGARGSAAGDVPDFDGSAGDRLAGLIEHGAGQRSSGRLRLKSTEPRR